ncbi:Pluviatolide O-methyltransferase (PhOMT3), partial [Durusdinium trenchii]
GKVVLLPAKARVLSSNQTAGQQHVEDLELMAGTQRLTGSFARCSWLRLVAFTVLVLCSSRTFLRGLRPGQEGLATKGCPRADASGAKAPARFILLGLVLAPRPALALSAEPSDLGLLLAAFLAGILWAAANPSPLRVPSVERGEDASPEPGLLNHMLQQTHGAAVLHALSSAGLLELIPPPTAAPKTSAELLRCQGVERAARRCSSAILEKLLHHLAGCQLLEEFPSPAGPAFRHTQRSARAFLEGAKSGKAFVAVNFAPEQVKPWWRIGEAMEGEVEGAPREDAPRNDATPFVLEHGRSVFEFYGDAANARASQAFDELMLQLSTSDGESGASAELVAEMPIWDVKSQQVPVVVDVGGGKGHLLMEILRKHDEWRGVLFDRPEVLETCEDLGSERVTLVPGNFFEDLPCQGDVFLLKWILHDWNDVQCRRILQCLRTALERSRNSGGSSPRLLILEQVVPETDDGSEDAELARASLNDLYLWVLYGGQERKVSEYAKLLAAEGFILEHVAPLSGFRLVALQCCLAS